jgi:hypothetical protein
MEPLSYLHFGGEMPISPVRALITLFAAAAIASGCSEAPTTPLRATHRPRGTEASALYISSLSCGPVLALNQYYCYAYSAGGSGSGYNWTWTNAVRSGPVAYSDEDGNVVYADSPDSSGRVDCNTSRYARDVVVGVSVTDGSGSTASASTTVHCPT